MNNLVTMFYRKDFNSVIDISSSHVAESYCGKYLLIFPVSSKNWETSALARNCREGIPYTSKTDVYIVVEKSKFVEGGRSFLNIKSFHRVPKERGALYVNCVYLLSLNAKPMRIKFVLYSKNSIIKRGIKIE